MSLASAQQKNQTRMADKAAGKGLTETPEQRRERVRALDAPAPTAAVAAPTKPAGRARSAAAIIDTYTGRATSGRAGGSKINVGLTQQRYDHLVDVENTVYRATQRRLNRAALICEAARRVAKNPQRYAAIPGGGAAAADPPPIGGRIPAEVYAALRDATYTATPRLAYSPLVSNALIELIDEINTTIGQTDAQTQ